MKWFYRGMAAVIVLSGLVVMLLFGLAFEPVKALVDGWMPDGRLGVYNLDVYTRLHPVWPAGLALILMGAAGLVWQSAVFAWLGRLKPVLQADWQTFRLEIRSHITSSRQAWGLAALSAAAGIPRLPFLWQPMGHDEAYTYMAFASAPLWSAVSDYSLPNNHIFHTLLVMITTRLLGNAPWVIRLPAFLAGMLLIPALYWAAASLYDRRAGWLAAAFGAVLPIWFEYSTRARGYTLLCVFIALAVFCAAAALRTRSLFAWTGLTLCSILGLYTIPIFLYPFAVIMAWLALSWLAGERKAYPAPGSFLASWLGCGLAAGLGTALVYLPVILRMGWGGLTGDISHKVLTWDGLAANVMARFGQGMLDWVRSPQPFSEGLFIVLLFLGLAGSLGAGISRWQFRLPLPLVGLAVLPPMLAIQRVAPEPRIWIFALVLVVIAAAGGLVWLINLLPDSRSNAAVAILTMCLLVAGLYQGGRLAASGNPSAAGVEEKTAVYFRENLASAPLILSGMDQGPALWYYFERQGLPGHAFLSPDDAPAFEKVYVLVDERYQQTLDGVAGLYPGVKDFLNLSDARLVTQIDSSSLYEVYPR